MALVAALPLAVCAGLVVLVGWLLHLACARPSAPPSPLPSKSPSVRSILVSPLRKGTETQRKAHSVTFRRSIQRRIVPREPESRVCRRIGFADD